MKVRLVALALTLASAPSVTAQQPTMFGGAYSTLDARRQHLVDDWVARFNATTGQKLEPRPFYDEIISVSAKVTFDAVTNALLQSPLTDSSGAPLGDALALIDRVDTVRGQMAGAPGDSQFRMYVVLTEQAIDTLARSREFIRRADNTVFHKGYPINYRARGGTPSIQLSVALDRRRADIDVDYRASSFPAALFNGHLSSANSDVRAGNNYDRHVGRWLGFQNWWGSFFGVKLDRAPDVTEERPVIPTTPRAGRKSAEVMMNDFLNAWLVEGNVAAAMSYVSGRAYACLAEDDESRVVDRGMAPYQLMMRLKAARDTLGTPASLDGVTHGVRLSLPALKVVQQPQHAQFVAYSVPDDIGAAFECEKRVAGNDKPLRREYGTYFGTTFYVRGHANDTVALLWAQEDGYWKIVSWQTGFDVVDTGPADAAAVVNVEKVAADRSLVDAARQFLEDWFVRKNYDAAFQYLSERSYACYDLMRGPEQPAATSAADAGQRIRAAMERAARDLNGRTLDALLTSVEPVHPAVRLMQHPYSRVFALLNVPSSLAEAADCAGRVRGEGFTGVLASGYGTAFGMTFRLRSTAGDAPVLRTLWTKENGNWRIQAYDVEVP